MDYSTIYYFLQKCPPPTHTPHVIKNNGIHIIMGGMHSHNLRGVFDSSHFMSCHVRGEIQI